MVPQTAHAVTARHRERVMDRLLVWLGNPFFCDTMRQFRWRVIHQQGTTMVNTRRRLAPEIFKSVLRPLYLHHAETIDSEPLRLTYLKAAKTAGYPG